MIIRKQWNAEMVRQAFPESLGFKVTAETPNISLLCKITLNTSDFSFSVKSTMRSKTEACVIYKPRESSACTADAYASQALGSCAALASAAKRGALTDAERAQIAMFEAGINRLNALENGEVLEPEPSRAPMEKVCEAKAPEPPRMNPDPAGFLLDVLHAPEDAEICVRTKRHGAIRVNGIIYHLERVVDDDPAIVWGCRIYPRHTDDSIQCAGVSMHSALQQALREFFYSSIAQADVFHGDAAHTKAALERIAHISCCKAG